MTTPAEYLSLELEVVAIAAFPPTALTEAECKTLARAAAALRFAAEDAEKVQEMRAKLEKLAAREVVFDGSDPYELDGWTPEDARRQGAEDAETLLARALLGGTRG